MYISENGVIRNYAGEKTGHVSLRQGEKISAFYEDPDHKKQVDAYSLRIRRQERIVRDVRKADIKRWTDSFIRDDKSGRTSVKKSSFFRLIVVAEKWRFLR